MQILPKVVFFQVKTPQEKVECICREAESHFNKHHKLFFYVDSDEALKYIDKLLWTTPQMSFLPHIASDEVCDDLVILTKSEKTILQARTLFNLTQNPIQTKNSSTIYELEDMTSPQKKELAKIKFDFYKSNHFHIISQ